MKIKFDGDTVNLIMVYSEESLKEVEKQLSAVEPYLLPSGGLTYKSTTDVTDWILKNFK